MNISQGGIKPPPIGIRGADDEVDVTLLKKPKQPHLIPTLQHTAAFAIVADPSMDGGLYPGTL